MEEEKKKKRIWSAKRRICDRPSVAPPFREYLRCHWFTSLRRSNKLMHHRSNRPHCQIALILPPLNQTFRKNWLQSNASVLFPSVIIMPSLLPFGHSTQTLRCRRCSRRTSSTVNRIVMRNAIFFLHLTASSCHRMAIRASHCRPSVPRAHTTCLLNLFIDRKIRIDALTWSNVDSLG